MISAEASPPSSVWILLRTSWASPYHCCPFLELLGRVSLKTMALSLLNDSRVGAGASMSDDEAVEFVCGGEQAVNLVIAKSRAVERNSISCIEQLNC